MRKYINRAKIIALIITIGIFYIIAQLSFNNWSYTDTHKYQVYNKKSQNGQIVLKKMERKKTYKIANFSIELEGIKNSPNWKFNGSGQKFPNSSTDSTLLNIKFLWEVLQAFEINDTINIQWVQLDNGQQTMTSINNIDKIGYLDKFEILFRFTFLLFAIFSLIMIVFGKKVTEENAQ